MTNCTHFHNHDDKEQTLRLKMPQSSDFEKVSMTFQLISDPTRLKILWFLCHHETCVNNIAATVEMSSPAVSHHLRLLKQAGLISARRDGKEMYYKLSDTPEALLIHRAIDDVFDIQCPL